MMKYMQFVGLLGLLVTVFLAGWWLSDTAVPTGSDVEDEQKTYVDVIESARETLGTVEDSIPVSSNSVFVYDGISVPDDTQKLNVSGRSLTGSLKAEIRQLTSLKELNLSDNNFTGLPAEVGQLSQLEVLNLSNNSFTGLPQELGDLKKLRVLDLRGNEYSSFDLDIIKKELPVSTQILVD